MAETTVENQAVASQAAQENKPSDKELNFRALEAKYQRQLEVERGARLEAERVAKEMASKKTVEDEDEESEDEPYIDRKRLKKEQAKFGQRIKQETQGEIQKAVQTALADERRQNWLKNNPDFYEVMKHADKFHQKDPELAETILEMPESFERQKLVYKNIKALGIHKPEVVSPPIQERVDANRRSPYYQPSGVGSAPYSMQGDFSPAGQKQAYQKMKELKARLGV
jgi:hypothetical protein